MREEYARFWGPVNATVKKRIGRTLADDFRTFIFLLPVCLGVLTTLRRNV